MTFNPSASGTINYYPDMDDEKKPLLSSGESVASDGLHTAGEKGGKGNTSSSLKGSS